MRASLANGIEIEYDVHGDGEPLLLIMGLGGQLVAWPVEFVDRMVEHGFKVIRFDNRDIGLSTKIDAPAPTLRQLAAVVAARKRAKPPYWLSDMADDAAGLLDHLGVARAHVVGVSMGGMIAQSLAIGHPDRVASLTSIMSNPGDRTHGHVHPVLARRLLPLISGEADDPIANGVEILRLISGPHFDASGTRRLVEEAARRNLDPAGTARQTMAILAGPDRTPGLRQVAAPTLVIHGLLDRLVLPSGGVATARAIPGSRLLMYPDMAHDLPRTRWDEVIDEIIVNTRRATSGGFAAADRAAV
jgi:pimeloyl-ACP methyl ester carboxylesterase